MNITDVFYRETDADAVALVHVVNANARTIRDKGSLWRNVATLCAFLLERGAKKGDKALILTGTSIESLEMLLASFRLGMVAVPVNPFMGQSQLLELIDRTAPSVCLLGDVDSGTAAHLAARCRSCIYLQEDTEPQLAAGIAYSEVLQGTGASHARAMAATEGEDLALIMHTSGSQGKPKSIRFSHQDLKDFFVTHDYHYSQYSTAQETQSGLLSPLLTTLPCSHLGGLAICLQGLIMSRATYLLNHFTPRAYLKLVAETKCSMLMLVPSMYISLLNEMRESEPPFDSLKYCITLGEGCSPELRRRIATAFGATVTSAYSLTECQSGLGFTQAELASGEIREGSCGRLLYGEAKLVNGSDDEAADGELWVRNDTVHECYEDVSLNQAKMQDGWFKTGDLFHRDGDGYFFHKGRVDSMFVSNGKNIYPQEVEQTLLRHRLVQRVCVLPISDKNGSTVVAALVQGCAGADEQDIIAHALQHGSTHTVPKLIKLVDAIPEVGPKKVDRSTCQAMLQDEYDRRVRTLPAVQAPGTREISM